MIKENDEKEDSLSTKFYEIQNICTDNNLRFSLHYDCKNGYYCGFNINGKEIDEFFASCIEDVALLVLLYLHENYDRKLKDE